MDFLIQFLQTFIHYFHELWWTLLIGFLLSGIFYKFVPSNFVEKYLGKEGVVPILIASVVGVILPVCCIGSLPIAITLRRKGATLGSVLAFLVATPATSISALAVTWKLLGLTFTIVIFCAAVLMAILMGLITGGIHVEAKKENEEKHCCHNDSNDEDATKTTGQKLKEALHYAFITLPKEMGFEIIMGVALASIIMIVEPIQMFINKYLKGLLGYGFVLVVGLLSYVCSTASVPMADALMQSGLSQGQGLCYLLVGPITSYATILVIKKDFGTHVLIMYLSVIASSSLLFGIIFDLGGV